MTCIFCQPTVQPGARDKVTNQEEKHSPLYTEPLADERVCTANTGTSHDQQRLGS